MSTAARALLGEPPYRICVGDVLIPKPGPGEVLVRVAYTAVSPGTELRCLAGRQPDTPAGVWIPGYSASGTVVETGEGCEIAIGTRVYCAGTMAADHTLFWGGHCSLALRREADLFALPDRLDMLEASFVHLAAVAQRGVRVSQPRPQDKVVVIGLGPIGQFSARLFVAVGADVLALDLSPNRVAAACAAGVDARVPGWTITEAVLEKFGRGADIVVDATGSPAVIGHAIDAARQKPWDDSPEQGPKVVIQGSYPADLPIPYQEAFLKEVTFLVPRDSQSSDIRRVIDMMADGRIRASDLASIVARPEDAQGVYDRLRQNDSGLLSAAFDWS